MSGRPNPDQVAQLRAALAEVSKETLEIESIKKELSHRELRLECAQQRLEKAAREVKQLLDAMDCGPNSNTGSFQRMTALLTMLISPQK